MSKYDKSKFYFLQLMEDFFDEDAIDWLEDQSNGKEYSLFYLKLCLKSLRTNGILIRKVGNILIPYDPEKLGELTNTHPDTVKVAVNLLIKIGLVQQLENGALFLTQVENMIGSQSKGAFKKQIQIAKREMKIEVGGKEAEKIPPELELEQELELELNNMSSNSLPYKEIVDYLNKKVGSKYKHTAEKTRRCIKARFNENFTFDDFKKVIDTKVAEWRNNPKMQQYLRPETLFGTKFESYLNQPSTAPKVASWYDEYLEKEKTKIAETKEESESLEDLEEFFSRKKRKQENVH